MTREFEQVIDYREQEFIAYFKPLAKAMDETTIWTLSNIEDVGVSRQVGISGIEVLKTRGMVYWQLSSYHEVCLLDDELLLSLSEVEFQSNYGHPIQYVQRRLLDEHFFYSSHLQNLIHDFVVAHSAHHVSIGKPATMVTGWFRDILRTCLADVYSDFEDCDFFASRFSNYLQVQYAPSLTTMVNSKVMESIELFREVKADLGHLHPDQQSQVARGIVADRIAMDTKVLRY